VYMDSSSVAGGGGDSLSAEEAGQKTLVQEISGEDSALAEHVVQNSVRRDVDGGRVEDIVLRQDVLGGESLVEVDVVGKAVLTAELKGRSVQKISGKVAYRAAGLKVSVDVEVSVGSHFSLDLECGLSCDLSGLGGLSGGILRGDELSLSVGVGVSSESLVVVIFASQELVYEVFDDLSLLLALEAGTVQNSITEDTFLEEVDWGVLEEGDTAEETALSLVQYVSVEKIVGHAVLKEVDRRTVQNVVVGVSLEAGAEKVSRHAHRAIEDAFREGIDRGSVGQVIDKVSLAQESVSADPISARNARKSAVKNTVLKEAEWRSVQNIVGGISLVEKVHWSLAVQDAVLQQAKGRSVENIVCGVTVDDGESCHEHTNRATHS